MSKEAKESRSDKSSPVGTMFVCAMAVIYILVGAVILFVPQVSELYLAYLLCGILIVFGIVYIVRYFIKESYHDVHDYGFSIGTLFVLIGACGLARAQQVADRRGDIDASYFVGVLRRPIDGEQSAATESFERHFP